MDGLRCIDEFTYRCLDVEHRNYFNTLYQGTTQVIVDLCQRGQYQSGEWHDAAAENTFANDSHKTNKIGSAMNL